MLIKYSEKLKTTWPSVTWDQVQKQTKKAYPAVRQGISLFNFSLGSVENISPRGLSKLLMIKK